MRTNIFYTWVVPLLWTVGSMLSFRWPGDEYALCAIASMPGVWIRLLMGNGDVHDPMFLISIVVAGAFIMALVGLLMDRCRLRRTLWKLLFVVCALLVLVVAITSHPSLERALGKHGSWWAYVFFSMNIGLHLSILLSFAGRGLEGLWVRTKGKGTK